MTKMFNNLKQKYTAWRLAKKQKKEEAHRKAIKQQLHIALSSATSLPPDKAQAMFIKLRWEEAKAVRNSQESKLRGEITDALIDEAMKMIAEEKEFWEWVAPMQAEMNRRYGHINQERMQRFTALYDRAIVARETILGANAK